MFVYGIQCVTLIFISLLQIDGVSSSVSSMDSLHVPDGDTVSSMQSEKVFKQLTYLKQRKFSTQLKVCLYTLMTTRSFKETLFHTCSACKL